MINQSIGIFDSGLGGLTVMNAIADLLPHENIIYLGDTGNLPYGGKTKEEILHYCKENILFLKNLGVKLIVIACHTASITSDNQLESDSNPPIINMVIPTLSLIEEVPREGHIVLLGTKKTISSGIYQKMILKQDPSLKLTTIACPLFVSLVEEGFTNHPIAKSVAKSYLAPLREKKIDTLILGCTHYPFLKKTIQEIPPLDLNLIDPSHNCARHVKKILIDKGLLNKNSQKPLYQFFVSDSPNKFYSLAKELLNHPVDLVSLITSIS